LWNINLLNKEGEIMPFVTINILEGKSKEYIKKVSDSINEAVIETMDFPDDDRYQVINQLSDDCMQYQGREEDRVMMHLVMRSGRSNKAKQAFYKKVVEYLNHRLQIKPENIFITITENHDVDFSFKDGVAQFVV
jgi:phenylpyruvate tautomerase PptA (4-oxalocrotonate tautomerase family)|tara:strand:+ start:126 stop:530 length:405 start_codon:yes stop_codon:yes gene_type:complete